MCGSESAAKLHACQRRRPTCFAYIAKTVQKYWLKYSDIVGKACNIDHRLM